MWSHYHSLVTTLSYLAMWPFPETRITYSYDLQTFQASIQYNYIARELVYVALHVQLASRADLDE